MKEKPERASNTGVNAISVAQTVYVPQPGFETFVNELALRIGPPLSDLVAPSQARITFMESEGFKRAIRRTSAYNRDVMEHFSYGLSNHLDAWRGRQAEVAVDTSDPLVWHGKHNNYLALNIIPSDELENRVERIGDYLRDKLGVLPPLVDFEPVIPLGKVRRRFLSEDEQRYPEILLGGEIIPPDDVAMNGLAVYVGDKQLRH